MTKVVNLYKEREFDVYIGRAGMGQDGYFGNPFPLQDFDTRAECLLRYQQYFYDRLEKDPEFKRRVLELKDKTLGCFCKPKDCHGDILIKYLDGENIEMGERD